jgi:hypothetical protein
MPSLVLYCVEDWPPNQDLISCYSTSDYIQSIPSSINFELITRAKIEEPMTNQVLFQLPDVIISWNSMFASDDGEVSLKLMPRFVALDPFVPLFAITDSTSHCYIVKHPEYLSCLPFLSILFEFDEYETQLHIKNND